MKFAHVTFLPAGMLRFLMGKMVPVPSMQSCLVRFLPMPSGSWQKDVLSIPRSQMRASGSFRSFWSDGCFPALTSVVLRAAM